MREKHWEKTRARGIIVYMNFISGISVYNEFFHNYKDNIAFSTDIKRLKKIIYEPHTSILMGCFVFAHCKYNIDWWNILVKKETNTKEKLLELYYLNK